jgi:hypothetical protein
MLIILHKKLADRAYLSYFIESYENKTKISSIRNLAWY